MTQAQSDFRADQLAPHSVEAEEAVLGSILISPDALFEVLSFLKPEDFFIVRHQWIYESMLMLHERRDPIDYLTVVTELEQGNKLVEVGGAAYILSLINKTPSALNVEGYGRIVERTSIRRRLIDAASQIARVAHSEEPDIENVIGKAEQAIFEVTERRLARDLVPIRDALSDYFDHVSFMARHQEEVMGVPTGFIDLDRMLGGLQKSDLLIIAARPGMGKCLGKGTPVLMYSGEMKPVEAIQIGDLVMGPDSRPRRVLALGRGREMMYWIRQNHGDDYRVNASHILSLKRSKNERNRLHGEVMNISVTDALAQLANIHSRWKGYKVAVDFPDQRVPIDPYILGVWLGDGTTANSTITVADPEIIGALGAYATLRGERLVMQHSNTVHTPVYRITAGTAATGRNVDGSYKNTSMQSQLRELEVLGNKHLPDCYLHNSREVRLQVLAGIIDTDGSLEFNGYVVTLKSERLARDLVYLARSLGLGVSIRPCIKSCTNSSVPNHRNTYFRVDIVGQTNMIPVRLTRKQASPRRQIKDPLMTGITIEPDCVDDYYGFELDGDGLFLLGDFTVTHNSSWLNSVVMNAARMNQRVALFSLEMSNEQLVQRFVSAETHIPSHKLREGKLDEKDWAQFLAATQYIGTLPIYLDDTPALSTSELRTKSRRLHLEYGLDLIVIDYLQLMTTPYKSENRVQEISYISRALKQLARELNVPVVSAAQLSRAVEQRNDKRPLLSDLRESGCLAGESLVYLPKDGRYVPIRELAGKKGFEVLSLNIDTWKLEPAVVSNAFCTGTKPVYRMTTKLGRTIRATGNHKFLTIDGWKRLDELANSEQIALPRRLDSDAKQTLSDVELGLLAHLIGDGCTLPTHAVQYTTREHDLAITVARLAKEVIGGSIEPRICPERSWYQVYLTPTQHLTRGVRNPVGVWLEQFGLWGRRSYEKFIPKQVFSQPAEAIAVFLRHLWATDGCIRVADNHYPDVYYATSSPQLASDVQSLLLRLSINACIKRSPQGTKGRDQYHVIVTGLSDLKLFVEVGAVGDYKRRALQQVADYCASHREKTNRDVIPSRVWEGIAIPAMQAAGISKQQFAEQMGYAYSNSALYKQNLSRKRAMRVADIADNEQLRRLAESDVYWDRITSIEDDGVTDVYDLTVPRHANFVSCNIILHNSIEQDSDVVMFIYRDAYYDQETPEGNKAEIHVAKHRNGPTGVVELIFIPALTQFQNAARHTIDLDQI